jgi:arsenate reductase
LGIPFLTKDKPVPKANTLKIYHYPACSTCKKALKFLDSQSIPYEAFHIVETPPSLAELRHVLAALKSQGVSLKALFNTSGAVYKDLQLATKLPALTEAQSLELLSENGKLIKRPFVVGPHFSAAGFQEKVWMDSLA